MTPAQAPALGRAARGRALVVAGGAVLALVGGLLLALGQTPAAHARPLGLTFNVTSTANAGAGSLRHAIFSANASPGIDTIKFDLAGCPCTILLSNGLPTITETLVIAGPGTDELTVDGAGSHRIFDIDNVPVYIAGLTLQNGSVPGRGAAIRSTGPLTLTNVNVLSNTAALDGGGVFVTDALSLTGGRFENNASQDSGGGLYAENGLVLSGTQLISNTALSQGGGIFLQEAGTLQYARFERNQTLNGDGGGLFTDYTVWLTETVFISNTTGSYGGGLRAGEATISGGRFEQNSSPAEGGGIYAYGLAITDTVFLSNTAGRYAGGLYGTDTVLSGGLFQGNHSGGEAGGAAAGSLVMSGTVLIGNSADNDGAGVYTEGEVSVHNARFEANHSAGGDGGGLNASGTLTLTASAFFDNSAVRGGGVYARDGSQTNTVFGDNSASDTGGAIYITSPASMHIQHVTVAGSTPRSGTGITVASGSAHITNTIVSQYATGILLQFGTATQDYNLFFGNTVATSGGVTGGAHSVNADPKFVDPAANDYHLGLGSAAEDEGADVGVATDYDGDARPMGAGYDIGFDEMRLRLYLPVILR